MSEKCLNAGKLITKGMIDQISGHPNLAAAGGGKTRYKSGKRILFKKSAVCLHFVNQLFVYILNQLFVYIFVNHLFHSIFNEI